jgi:hypothetical protein
VETLKRETKRVGLGGVGGPAGGRSLWRQAPSVETGGSDNADSKRGRVVKRLDRCRERREEKREARGKLFVEEELSR